MFRDISLPAVNMGLLAAFVGFSASFSIVLAGLTSVGASEAQAATGLFFAALAMGACSIWLPLVTRTPAAVAWSTPGAAFLASTAALPGGFAEAVGALICCALLILVTGFIPALGRLVASIPKPIANALLAGVVLRLCFAPAEALGAVPLLALPVIGAWVGGLMLNRLMAMPFAVAALLIVLFVGVDLPAGAASSSLIGLPVMDPLQPMFTVQGFFSIALPLYLVTMAGQNIPGFAVLELNGYAVRRQPLIRSTGLASLATAPFGAVPVNMSAITAAMMAGDDAGRDRARRYWAAVISGLAYIAFAFLAEPIVALAAAAPSELIVAVAGLALIPALVGSVAAAFADQEQLEAPALTFLLAASGMTLLGVSGAFWGVVLGSAIWLLKRLRRPAD